MFIYTNHVLDMFYALGNTRKKKGKTMQIERKKLKIFSLEVNKKNEVVQNSHDFDIHCKKPILLKEQKNR